MVQAVSHIASLPSLPYGAVQSLQHSNMEITTCIVSVYIRKSHIEETWSSCLTRDRGKKAFLANKNTEIAILRVMQ